MNEKEFDEGVFNEDDLKKLIKEAIKEVNEEKEEKKEKETKEIKEKIDALEGNKKTKVLKVLENEKEKALLKLCSLDIDDPEYNDVLNKYNRLNDAYEEVKNNPFHKVDWSKVIITLIIIGASAALIFIMLIIENSAAFPRSRNALNMILAIFKKAL